MRKNRAVPRKSVLRSKQKLPLFGGQKRCGLYCVVAGIGAVFMGVRGSVAMRVNVARIQGMFFQMPETGRNRESA